MQLQRHFYLRALGIISIKAIAYTVLMVLAIDFFAENIPMKVFLLAMTVVFFLVTFLFGEWIFSVPRMPARGVAIAIIITYLLDVFLNTLIWSYLWEANLFYTFDAGHQLIMFTLHAAALGAAYYERKRLGIFGKGPVEGIAS